MFDMIPNLLNLMRLVLCPNKWSIIENTPRALEKYLYKVCSEGIQPFNMKNRDIMCEEDTRYKKHCT